MKIAVLATAAATAYAANATPTPLPTAKITTICNQKEIATINSAESTVAYNECRNDAQKAIFDGLPTDICAVPSCVVAVQKLVGVYPKCVFDTRTPWNDVRPYFTACGIDPTVTITPAPTTANVTTRPIATLSGSNSTDGVVTVAPTEAIATIAADRTKVAPTTAPASGAVSATASLMAIGAVVYAMA
ncbi:hypothetical protein THRCLA_02002 [Thraustotheca clavata]|uniref:Secreted protein n=1 Tax=Thraustotheca clavata TaxID=74557 RepID=A0A0A7CLX2_9STRA|nr:secreted protein [Thraustotheca clavata]OQS05920.1 hypothetical protein THRCLA_02002 [Thraustotheca clavata]